MFKKFNQKINLWKIAFKQKKYQITFIVVFILFYLINGLMAVYNRIKYSQDIFDLIALFTQGFYQTIKPFAFISSLIVGLLTAFLFVVLFFRASVTQEGTGKKLSIIGYLTLFFGFFVTGCPTCGLGLLAILGLGASILAMPFKGAEISILAIIFLVWIIDKISEKILTCEVKKI